MARTLTIPRPIFDAMLAHAREEYPNECCGQLAGSVDGAVSQHLPLVNELRSPTAHLSESKSLITAQKAMRAAGTEVVAVYHSHPSSDPVPSKRDLAENAYGEIVHLIVGLAGPEPDVKAWRLTERGYEAVIWVSVE